MATPADDFSHRNFIYHEFFQANGPLSKDTVMDYFMTSIFADPRSSNAALRMQYAHSDVHRGMPIDDEEKQLERFTGVEFVLAHAIPPDCFIIHKRDRIGPKPTDVTVLAAYFIMNNWIYCAPDVYSVLSGRLRNSLQHLRSSLDTLREHRPEFTPRTGYSWDISQKPEASLSSLKAEKEGGFGAGKKPSTSQPSMPEKNQFSALKHAIRTTEAYLAERTPLSVIPILPSEVLPPAQLTQETIQAGATPADVKSIGYSGPGAHSQSPTLAGSFPGYTPSGVGADRSVSFGGPGTPMGDATSPGGATPGQPGVAGQGKKKRRRQATAALKASLGSGGTPMAQAGSPISPME